MNIFLPLTLLASVVPGVRATADSPETLPIGIIDFYGLRSVSERQARQALQIKEGDPVPESVEAAERRLEALPGVIRAHVACVCCDQGKALLYVGIECNGVPALRFRPAPRGAVRLPDEIVQAGKAFEQALSEAVTKGVAGEDDSRGHSLMHDPAARTIQNRFVGFAARDRDRLRDVLCHSADAEHRALSAQVLGYASDKREVIGDLLQAMRDPAEGVRNNTMRALTVIAQFASERPELRLRISPLPFVEMLNSVVWTDRNKASAALMELSEKRDPALLRSLRAHALPSLIEMARWKSQGHAMAAFFLLGRVGSLSEETIQAAWSRGDRATVVEAARRMKG